MFSDDKISIRPSDCVLKPPYPIETYSSCYKIFVTEIKDIIFNNPCKDIPKVGRSKRGLLRPTLSG